MEGAGVTMSESEVQEDIYSDCLVSLGPGAGAVPGATVLSGALHLLRPHSPYAKDLRRRSGGKRQAPQPPDRPPPATTPAPAPTPSLCSTPTPTSTQTPVTTVQMLLEEEKGSSHASPQVTTSSDPPQEGTPPSQLGPPTPPRSAASLEAAARNMMICLIDDESDSESHLSDSFEEYLVFPARPCPLPPLPLPPPSPVVVTLPHLPRPVPAHTPTLFQVTAQAMMPPPPVSGIGGGGSSSMRMTRGRARRLAHSTSDPGLPRVPRPQPGRAPLMAGWEATLDQMSEEEGDEGGVMAGLQRSDSQVTVAHLQEELMVAPGLRLKVTLTNITALVLVTALALPHASVILYTTFRLVFGTLFPAYYSYKAVKTKNVKEYVKWMMYWIVFAFFTCFETLTDLFISFWFPFYYELKILVVLWLLSPATRGSSILYRKFVHPWLARREEDIDQCIAQARQQGYSTVVQLGTKGVNYATTVLMQTALKGGGGLMNQLRRSYSQGELVGDDGDLNRNVKALPPHMHGDHYSSDFALDHHALPPGTSQPQTHSLQHSHSKGALQPTSQSQSLSQGLLQLQSQPQLLSHGLLQLQSQPQSFSQGGLLIQSQPQIPLQPQSHSQGPLLLQSPQPHMSSSLQLQAHPIDALHSLQQQTETLNDTTQAVITSCSQPASIHIVTDNSYSPVRYRLSVGTPQDDTHTQLTLQDNTHTPATSQHLTATIQDSTHTPDAPYSPPLTRHRARYNQAVLD